MHPISRRRPPSFILAVVALFLVLAGTAAAAAEFVVDSPDDMAPNVVTTPAIANQSVTASKLAPGATAEHPLGEGRPERHLPQGLPSAGLEADR